MRRLVFISFLIIIVLCCCSSSSKDQDSNGIKLLFIGNSLTYTNNLPEMVKSIATTNGIDISYTTIANPNYALIDHWNDELIQPMIESGDYDFVIVQQGPSSQTEGRDLLIEYGGRINELCESSGSQLAYYMVWPALVYYNTFDGVIESYSLAASMNNNILCPVGQVWKAHFDDTSDFSYYGADGFHPSFAGSQIAAEVIYNTLFIQ